MLDVATVQRDAVAHRNFIFEDSRLLAGARMDHAVVLNVAAIADANVIHITAQHGIAPNRGLFAQLHVSNDLRTLINVGAVRDLRMNTAKWSNHNFSRHSNIGIGRHLECGGLTRFLTNDDGSAGSREVCATNYAYAKLRPMNNRRLLSTILFGVLSLSAACAGSLFKVKPMIELPPLAENARSASAGGVTIRVAQLLSDEESQDLFEANLPLGGILPVRLEFAFESGAPVEVKRARFHLIDAAGHEWKLISPKAAVARILKTNDVYAYNPNSRKQFEKEFAAYAIDLADPLSADNRRRQGFLFFETPKKEPVASPQGLTLRVDHVPQAVEIKLN
jgi:hypothetical protein